MSATIEQHRRTVYAYALSLTRNRDDAEDLTQFALIQGLLASERLQQAVPAAYLRVVVRHRYLYARTRPREVSFDEPLTENGFTLADTLADPRQDVAAHVEGQETNAELSALLAGLPAKFRETLWLIHGENCTTEEAADTLQLPPGVVKSRMVRAMKLARKSVPT